MTTALRRAFLAAVPPPPVLDAVAGIVDAATRAGASTGPDGTSGT